MLLKVNSFNYTIGKEKPVSVSDAVGIDLSYNFKPSRAWEKDGSYCNFGIDSVEITLELGAYDDLEALKQGDEISVDLVGSVETDTIDMVVANAQTVKYESREWVDGVYTVTMKEYFRLTLMPKLGGSFEEALTE